jgi:iron complex outermembrane receptor protein
LRYAVGAVALSLLLAPSPVHGDEAAAVPPSPAVEPGTKPSSAVEPSASAQGVERSAPASAVERSAPAAAVEPSAAVPAAAPAQPTYESAVSGKRRALSRGAGDFHIDVGALAAVPRANAADFLKLAPGVLLTNEGGENHAEQIFLRGFDAREGQDLELSVDGVPINESGNLHGNGYADTHFIIPELISSLRVLEGPFDPRQGNFAVAGSADYHLALAQRGITTKLSVGSYGTTRLVLLAGPRDGSDETFAAVELYQTRGFGQNRDGARASAMAQYAGKAGKLRYRLFGSAYFASFHSAGVLRDDDWRSGRVKFFDTYDSRQGEDAQRYSLGGELGSRSEHFHSQNQLFVIARTMRLRENFTGFLLDVQETQQSGHEQRGDLIDLDVMEWTLGLRGSARASGKVFGQPQELEVGYLGRADFVAGSQARVEAATRHPYHLDTDLDARLGDIGLYLDANLRATSWLAVRGGVRADFFIYQVIDNCAVQSVAHPSRTMPPGDSSCLSQQDFGAHREPFQRASAFGASWMPRASLILGPLWGVGASASYGQGVRSIDPIYIADNIKTPFAAAQSVEAGLTFSRRTPWFDVSARAIFFQTRVERDLIFSQIEGRNILGGPSVRTGSANALRVTGSWFDLAANATYVHAAFDDTRLLIPYVPDFVLRVDGAAFGELPFRRLRLRGRPFRLQVAPGVTYIAPRPLPQGERSNSVFTIDLSASVAWWIFEVGLVATNLLNNRYRLGEYNYLSDFHSQSAPTLVPERHFAAGAPRALFFTLSVNVGGAR